MPESGFSWARIREHLRKWLALYIAATVALCFVNHLVFTVTRPGYSDDETIKIMLLNVEAEVPEDTASMLLAALQSADGGIRALEFEQLAAVSAGDATSEMLLSVKLTGGFGDIYLTDEAGLAMLEKRQAVADSVQIERCMLTGGAAYLAVMRNTTDMESAMAALEILQTKLGE